MIFYLLIFLYLVMTFWIVQRRKLQHSTWLAIVTFLILFLIAGFRHYSVGSDTEVYKIIFESKMSLPPLTDFFSSRFELGFLYLNHLIYNSITTNYSIYLAIYSFLTLGITFFVLKKESHDFYLSLIIYFGFGVYTDTMSLLRSSVSVSFVYLAYYLMNRNRRIASVISVIIASSFHLSALAFFVVYFFRHIKIGNRGLWLAGGISVVGYLTARSIIENLLSYFVKYESYTQSDSYGDSAKIASILGAVIMVSVFLFGEYIFRGKVLTQRENFLRNIVLIATVINIIAIQTVTLGRVVSYFTNFVVLYIPLIVSKMDGRNYTEQQRKALMVLSIILLFGLRYFVVLWLRPEWNIIIPYRSTMIDFFAGF